MTDPLNTPGAPPWVEVEIEIPRGSFLKRGSHDDLDFISPVPCPYNYGSVPQLTGGDGDFLDAILLGPRLPRGTRVQVPVRGAVGMWEREIYEDKLVCSYQPVSTGERRKLLRFMGLYARCKGLLNVLRGKGRKGHCAGWVDAADALSRAKPFGSEKARRSAANSAGVRRGEARPLEP